MAGVHFGHEAPVDNRWLAIASIVGGVGGVAWLAWLPKSDARRASMRVDRGETVTIVYDPDDPYEFSSDERAAIAQVARQASPDIRRVPPHQDEVVLEVLNGLRVEIVR